MQSRMDKYNTSKLPVRSRTQKNKDLYEDVRNSSLTEFDVNSNISVIDDSADHIDVNKVRRMLDKRYSGEEPKRRSITIPDFPEPVIEDTIADTKEYDINAILAKAKQGKNVDYNKERLRKVREAQFEILNNLDLELKKVEESKNSSKDKEAEDNLMNLINTITELEIRNKTASYKKETSEALDLLSDLQSEGETEEVTEPVEVKMTQVDIVPEEIIPEEQKKEPESTSLEHEDHIEKTLSKLDIDMSSYDDFADISKHDASSIIIKIIIFFIVISLVVGAVYIIDKVLELGLF